MSGVLVLNVRAELALGKTGSRIDDVILSVNDRKTADTAALLRLAAALAAASSLKLGDSRDQKEIPVPLIP